MSELGHKTKANRRRGQEQALEIEACSITLSLRTTSGMIHHLAPGSPRSTSKLQRPLPLCLGWQKLAKKEEEEKEKAKQKKRKEKGKTRKKREGAKIRSNSKRKKKQATPSLRDKQKLAPGESTNPAKPSNPARPSKQLPSSI